MTCTPVSRLLKPKAGFQVRKKPSPTPIDGPKEGGANRDYCGGTSLIHLSNAFAYHTFQAHVQRHGAIETYRALDSWAAIILKYSSVHMSHQSGSDLSSAWYPFDVLIEAVTIGSFPAKSIVHLPIITRQPCCLTFIDISHRASSLLYSPNAMCPQG